MCSHSFWIKKSSGGGYFPSFGGEDLLAECGVADLDILLGVAIEKVVGNGEDGLEGQSCSFPECSCENRCYTQAIIKEVVKLVVDKAEHRDERDVNLSCGCSLWLLSLELLPCRFHFSVHSHVPYSLTLEGVDNELWHFIVCQENLELIDFGIFFRDSFYGCCRSSEGTSMGSILDGCE